MRTDTRARPLVEVSAFPLRLSSRFTAYANHSRSFGKRSSPVFDARWVADTVSWPG